MSQHDSNATSSQTNNNRTNNTMKSVKVWDPLVRLFHWSLVLSFSIAYLTGEEESLWHINTGYIVLGLISFRLIWGLIGTKYARFHNFVTGRSEVLNYLKSLLSHHPKHYLGHNPAGGWMIIALLISLFITTLSGMQLYAVEDGLGPFASIDGQNISLIKSAYADDDDDDEHSGKESLMEEFWEETHEVAANMTLLLVFIHIAGVIVAGRIHKENLVKAMLTGKKAGYKAD